MVLSSSKIAENLLKRKDFDILLNKCIKSYGVATLQFTSLRNRLPCLVDDFSFIYKEKWFNVYKKELSDRKIDVFLEDDFCYNITFKRKDLLNDHDEKCYIVFDDLLSILSAGINFKEDYGTFGKTLIPATKIVLGSYNPFLALTGICRLNCRKNAKRFAKFCKDTGEANRIDLDRKFSLAYSFLREEWRNYYKNMF